MYLSIYAEWKELIYLMTQLHSNGTTVNRGNSFRFLRTFLKKTIENIKQKFLERV